MILRLNDNWRLRDEPLEAMAGAHAVIAAKAGGWMPVAALPCDVHMPLIEQGRIADPSVGEHCLDCQWIEKRSWWFMKCFTAGREILESPVVELVAEGLDAEADVFLNGRALGHHRSQTWPMRVPVAGMLQPENTLLIRVTSGLEHYCDQDTGAMEQYIHFDRANHRGDPRRVMVRKPAYVYGWDWNPRIATCGISGITLEAFSGVALRDVAFRTASVGQSRAVVQVIATVETLHPTDTQEVIVKAGLRLADGPQYTCEKTIYATAGYNYVDMEIPVNNPALWWPNGMGGQPLYTVTVTAECAAGSDRRELRAGIRTIALDQTPIDGVNRYFRFLVNGKAFFAKGGNWETPDSIYLRITAEKYDHLVREARDANFNMFRFNGVGSYERDAFYEACDRYGIMIWHDFAFSCAVYPDHLPWFIEECRHEVEHVIRSHRNHPSLALWCGSNECQWLLLMQGSGYWRDKPDSPEYQGGLMLYNRVIPQAVRQYSRDIPYWNCSPFGGRDLNCNEVGDRHHWHDAFMHADMDRRITPETYDGINCKFCSEFGCVGPVKRSSIERYYGPGEIEVGSRVWELHTNTFEKKTIKAAIERHYRNPVDGLSLEEYLLLAGLFQGVTLEYAYNAMRASRHNFGALNWSYNDCWGEVGWSIIDYYTTRKISYYFVKRALAHRSLFLREAGGKRYIHCFNDTCEPLEFTLEHGYLSYNGEERDVSRMGVTVPPLTRTVVGTVDSVPYDFAEGVFFARPCGGADLLPAILRSKNTRERKLAAPGLSVTNLVVEGNDLSYDVSADRFAHAVYFDLPDDVRLSDAYFDLLPRETRHITAQADTPFPPDTVIRAFSVHQAMLR